MRFGSLDIAFDAGCLRPRPWTVGQSQWGAEVLADAPDGPLLELCTGAGQIGLLAVAGTQRRFVGIDVERTALDYARRNAENAGLGSRVDLRCGDMTDVLADDELFPVVLADPPWVTTDEVDDLPEDPDGAIDGGDDGLDIARTCLQVCEDHLVDGGVVVIQLGSADQAGALGAWAEGRGRLTPGELRQFDDGVLLRLDRRPR